MSKKSRPTRLTRPTPFLLHFGWHPREIYVKLWRESPCFSCRNVSLAVCKLWEEKLLKKNLSLRILLHAVRLVPYARDRARKNRVGELAKVRVNNRRNDGKLSWRVVSALVQRLVHLDRFIKVVAVRSFHYGGSRGGACLSRGSICSGGI